MVQRFMPVADTCSKISSAMSPSPINRPPRLLTSPCMRRSTLTAQAAMETDWPAMPVSCRTRLAD
jgi:hypothetical protein